MAALGTERSMSLNLDSWLNGVSGADGSHFEELLQVNESFFDAYVQELEGQAPSYQGASYQQVAQMSPVAGDMQGAIPSGPFHGANAGVLAFPPGLPGFHHPAIPMSGIQSLPPVLPQSLTQTVSTSMPSALSPGLGTPNASTGSLNQPLILTPSVTTGLPDQEKSGELQNGDGSNTGGADSGGDYVEIEEIDSMGRKKKRRIRTPKQQVLNKLAQQRYRERRKAKYSEMETTVEALVDQLEKLQSVEKTNKDLKAQNEELNKQLQEQRDQLQFLKQQLQFNTQVAAAAAAQNAGSESSAEPVVADYEALRSKLGGLIETMREVLGRHNLDIRLEGPRIKELPQEVVAELAAAVGDSCTLCMKLLSSNAPGVTQAMSKDMSRFNNVVCPFARATWNKALFNLNLSKEQESMLLELRETHLKNLRALLDDRHRLNMQAMALMIPRPSQDPTIEGQVQCRGQYGQMCALKQDSALSEALDKLKGNLKAEQRGFMEVNYHLMHKVLTPVQAAKLLVDAYPHNIDALALANCLAVKKGLLPESPAGDCSKDSQNAHGHGVGSVGSTALPVC